jgi:cytochrome c-type biogenesis protein
MEIQFALAFTAGLVATVNPCGFAMLPAYLAYFVGVEGDESATGPSAVGRALFVGAVVSAGFLVVFGVAGLAITVALQTVVGALPWAAIVVGVGVIVLGIALLSGWELQASLPKIGTHRGGKRVGGLFIFGVSYAIASLSCTLPIFLVVVVGTVTQGSLLAGVATFLVYGLGMSMLLLVVTLGVALGQRGLVGWMRRSSRHVSRISGGVLVLAGGWIVAFWATNLTRGPLEQGRAFIFVEQVSAWATNNLGDRAGLLGIGFALLLGAAAAYALWGRRRAEADAEQPSDPADETHASDVPTS